LRRLVSGLPPDMRGDRLVVPLQAYVDDSGNEPKLDFGRLGGLAERVGDAVAEPGAEFSHLGLSP